MLYALSLYQGEQNTKFLLGFQEWIVMKYEIEH